MKNIILVFLLIAFVSISCNKKMEEKVTVDTHMMNDGSEMMDGSTEMKTHTCPMHPEIEGMKGEKCSKCGMELTQNPTNKSAITKIYSCPMHPEVHGKLNSKCTKCGMPLTEPVL